MPVSDYTPSVDEVAAVTLQRTRNQYGTLAGTFNSTTTPTDTQVNELISKAADKVSLEIGQDIPAALRQDAKDVVALRAAMLIETSFFAEQVQSNRSPYPMLKEQFDEDIIALQNGVQVAEDNGGSLPDQPSSRPSYSFPDATGWLERPL